MSLTYERDDARRRLTVISHGPLTATDIIAVVDRQIAEDTWTYALLYETTAMPHDVTPLLAHLREATQRLGRRGPLAVVGQSPEIFGIARAYAQFEDESLEQP